MSQHNSFDIPGYTAIRKDCHFSYTLHEEVSIYVHKSTPYNEIVLQTGLQVVAVRVGIEDYVISICSVYIARSQSFTVEDLMQLINQLPSPIMLLGDFNAHNELWGSNRTGQRGRKLEKVLFDAELSTLNYGTSTRIEYNGETAIDISIVSLTLSDVMQWTVMPSPGDSDHYPIIMTMANREREDAPVTQLNIRKADWNIYDASDAWKRLPAVSHMTNEDALADVYGMIGTATADAIATFTVGKCFPKPWWSNE